MKNYFKSNILVRRWVFDLVLALMIVDVLWGVWQKLS